MGKLEWAVIIGFVVIFGFLGKLIVADSKFKEEYQAKCEAAGGEMLLYSRPKQSTQYSCVKKESVIDVN